MPLYDYVCPNGHSTEVRHGFDETYDAPCATCGAPVRRVFNPAPILFKGSGFYVTDSRSKTSAASAKPKSEAAEATKPAAAESTAKEPAQKSESATSDSAA